MINVLKVRKWGALLLVGFISVLAFLIGQIYYGFWGAIMFFLASLLVTMVLGNFLLKNAFSDMLEGNGVLVFDISSTGLFSPFIVRMHPPFIKGKFQGSFIHDIFDRKAVASLAKPVVVDKPVVQDKDGGLTFSITNDEYNAGRFKMFHYPVILYNSQLQRIVTKEFVMTNEKNMLVEHLLLYISRQMESLKQALLNFGRYVVETTMPKKSIFESKWFWIIATILILGGIGVIFFPRIIQVMQGMGGSLGGVKETISGTVG